VKIRNKEKDSLRWNEYYKIHREELLEKKRTYYKNNKEKCLDYYNKNKEDISYKMADYRLTHKLEINKYSKDSNIKVKFTVLSHYGNNKCACARCGFDDIRALSIDHINNNGNTHRNTGSLFRGTNFYHWLKNNNYPEGYQTLCMNCQFIKRDEYKESLTK
jgi:hypothetical protein